MVDNKSIMKKLTKFHKIIDDLQNIYVKIEDGDKVLLFLISLPIYFEHFKDAILYGKEGTINLDEVQTVVRLKELSKLKDLKVDDSGKGLSVSIGRSGSRGKKGKRYKSKSKSKVFDKSKFKCFTCHKTCHFKRDCLERGNKGNFVQIGSASDEDGYKIVSILVVNVLETEKSWFMDSDCSYHMCQRK